MAQAGVYAPGAVNGTEVVVRVNGIVREHVSMDWSGDTTGGLPEQVVSAGTGMRSRTGSILWAQQSAVEVEPPHPLRRVGGWPPREGDEVLIDAAVDTGQGPYSFRRFTGRIGRTTGSLTEGTLTSEITDTLGDKLKARVTIPPMVSGGYSSSVRVLWLALEQARLGLVPPATRDTVLHSLPQGGISPVIGGEVSFSPEGAWSMSGDPWGFEAWDNLLTYTTGASRGTKALLVLARGSSSWDSELSVRFVGGSIAKVAFSKTARTVKLTVAGTVVGTYNYLGAEAIPVLGFRAQGSQLTLYLAASGTSITLPVTLSAAVDAVWGIRMSSVDVQYTNRTAAQCAAWVGQTPSAPASVRKSGLEQQDPGVTRSYEAVSARSVVDAWSEATLASVWMDETGTTRAVARDRLLSTPVSRTLRVEEWVLKGQWQVGDDSVRSSVTVRGQQGALERLGDGSAMRSVIYQERTARAFEQPEVIERFIEAPDEEEWGPVDVTASRYGSDQMDGGMAGRGTWVGAVTSLRDSSSDPEVWAQQSGVGYTVAISRVGPRTLKVVETITNIPGDRTVYLKAATEGTSLHPAYRGQPSPTIRGAWKSTWADYAVTSDIDGPAWAPPLEHDADWWLSQGDALRVADALAAEVTAPMPTIPGAQVLWDPTRQIGDVEEWIATDSRGMESWRARVLVTGYAESWAGSVPEQSVDVRVISWTDPIDGKTYGDLAAVYARYSNITGTYQQVYDALPAAR